MLRLIRVEGTNVFRYLGLHFPLWWWWSVALQDLNPVLKIWWNYLSHQRLVCYTVNIHIYKQTTFFFFASKIKLVVFSSLVSSWYKKIQKKRAWVSLFACMSVSIFCPSVFCVVWADDEVHLWKRCVREGAVEGCLYSMLKYFLLRRLWTISV